MAADQLKLLKTERANAKRRMTTTLHVTEALISEENFEQIYKTKLQELRFQFIDSHTAYGDALVNSGAYIDDIDFLDEYVKQVMEHYNRVLRDSKPTLIHDKQLPQPAAMLRGIGCHDCFNTMHSKKHLWCMHRVPTIYMSTQAIS